MLNPRRLSAGVKITVVCGVNPQQVCSFTILKNVETVYQETGGGKRGAVALKIKVISCVFSAPHVSLNTMQILCVVNISVY